MGLVRPYNASPTDPPGFEGRSVFAAGGEGVFLLLPAWIFMIGRDPLIALGTRGHLCSHTLSPAGGGVHAAISSVSEFPHDKSSRSGSSMVGGPGGSAAAAGSSTIAPSTPAVVLRLLPRILVAGLFVGELFPLAPGFADASFSSAAGFADAFLPVFCRCCFARCKTQLFDASLCRC